MTRGADPFDDQRPWFAPDPGLLDSNPSPDTGAGTPRPLTVTQKRVLARLERALAACEKAGVAICGMDDSLLAYRRDDLERIADETTLYEAQRQLVNSVGTAQIIEDHGAYRESGGW